MNIAFFSPLPPARTGIADYSGRLIELLSEDGQITCFHDQAVVSSDELPASVTVFRTSRFHGFAEEKAFDLPLYQLGNSAHHAFMYPFLRAYPGVVDCHDVNLHHFFAHCLSNGPVGERTWADYLDLAHGGRSSRLARLAAAGLFHESQCFLFPLDLTCLTRQSWIVVHSDYARDQLVRHCPDMPVSVIAPPCHVPRQLEPSQRVALKRKLDYAEDAVLICSFGEILPKKGCFELLESFHALMTACPQAHLVYVGSVSARNRQFQRQAGAHPSRVRLTGYVEPRLYQDYLEIADIGVNLRYPSVGETSQTMLDMMVRGIPVIITDSHAGREIPDDCVLKVMPGNRTVSMLTAALRNLIATPDRAKSIGDAARSWITRHHNQDRIAENWREVLKNATQYIREQEKSRGGPPPHLLDAAHERWLQGYLARSLDRKGWQSPRHDGLLQEIAARLPRP